MKGTAAGQRPQSVAPSRLLQAGIYVAVFPVLQTSDRVIRVGDKLRLDASQSFVTSGEIEKLEIAPTPVAGFQEVSIDDPVLDWVYSVTGDVSASIRMTVDGSAFEGLCDLQVVSAEDDQLFSDDSDLVGLEPSIRKLLPAGKSTFLFVHREAKSQILESITNAANTLNLEVPTLDAVLAKPEAKECSKHLTLSMIFEGLANAADDVMSEKSANYRSRSEAKLSSLLAALGLTSKTSGGNSNGVGSVVMSRS